MTFTASQKELISKWIGEAIAPYSARADELQARVEEVEGQLRETRADNKQLRRRLDDSEVAHDDLENYGRRMNIRIEGIEYDNDETPDQLYEKVKGCLQEVDINVKKTDIVRFHRSGPPQRKQGRPTTAQTIVKFVRWDKRSRAHYANKRARQGNMSFRIHNDLTKRRFDLLAKARERLNALYPDDPNPPAFAYTDVNSNLKVRRGREMFNLNTEQDLSDIMRQLAE